MVNDVNRDREPIIKAVREQLDALLQERPGGSSWRRARRRLASRIETLQSDPNAHHAAMHPVDNRTDLSSCIVVPIAYTGRHDPGCSPPQLVLTRTLAQAS